MSFKDMLSTDASIFTNKEEFGVVVNYKSVDIDALYDELDDNNLDSTIFRISVAQSLVPTIAKNELFTIAGFDYRVIDFQNLDGITDIILNKRAT